MTTNEKLFVGCLETLLSPDDPWISMATSENTVIDHDV